MTSSQSKFRIFIHRAIDYITVSKVLETKGELEEVGGLGYITDLTNYVPSAANYKYYADIIQNDSILRQIIDASQKTINEADRSFIDSIKGNAQVPQTSVCLTEILQSLQNTKEKSPVLPVIKYMLKIAKQEQAQNPINETAETHDWSVGDE